MGLDLGPQRADTKSSNKSQKQKGNLNKKRAETFIFTTNTIELAETSYKSKKLN